ncbi:MAG: hypothetical protein E7162_05695 [Firmicutes bacterium]|nr:hypothetical protein [Bacillota bacterium]
MKKILSLILCGILLLTITGCGNKENTNENKKENNDNKKEEVKNKILKCTGGYSDDDSERTYTYEFTFDVEGNKLDKVYFKDSITYKDSKLSDYNINENKKWCTESNGYGGLECSYEISDDKKVSTIEYNFEINKLDNNAKDVFASEVEEGIENYTYETLKPMLEKNYLTCE